MSESIGMWMGRPIEDLTREELLRVVRMMMEAHKQEQTYRLQEEYLQRQLRSASTNRGCDIKGERRGILSGPLGYLGL